MDGQGALYIYLGLSEQSRWSFFSARSDACKSAGSMTELLYVVCRRSISCAAGDVEPALWLHSIGLIPRGQGTAMLCAWNDGGRGNPSMDGKVTD